MQLSIVTTLVAFAAFATAITNEHILAVYIFHRHGDRTAKAWPPANLTALGAAQVYSSGTFYRARYLRSGAALAVAAISPDTPVSSQLSITAPEDAVLQDSASVFIQALYPPPAGQTETLANGSTVEPPPGWSKYVPVGAVGHAVAARAAENLAWLQGATGCDDGVASSNGYLSSAEYRETNHDTALFYRDLLPVINSTYNANTANFKNAYTIFDYINVAKIHNATIPSSSLLTNATLSRLRNLASIHEWNLAYNASQQVRAIAGSVLAGQVLNSLEAVIDGTDDTARFNVQFGAYGTFMSFFGLAQLFKASPDFYGICDYASSMVFELYTTSSAAKPSPDDINVRFLFANGSAADTGLKPYALFGQDKTSFSWADFKSGMNQFAVKDMQQYCQLCGATSEACGASSSSNGHDNAPFAQSSNDSDCGNGVSNSVAGVIGALVTLVVIIGIQAAMMLFGGLRVVKKSTLFGCRSMEDSSVKG